MSPAELKTIRESLGLSAQWLADRAGVLQRSVQYWEAGRSRVPEDVADLVLRIDAQFAEATRQALAVVDEQTEKQGRQPETVRLYRYRDDAALWAALPDMDGLPVTAHAALLARVRLALLDRGQAVVIEYV
jgi:transcriptional regulator with XRE-family HTH domain